MQPSLSRREIAGAGAIVTLATTTLGSMAQAKPTSEIEIAYRKLQLLVDALDKSALEFDAANARYTPPQRPAYKFGINVGNALASADDQGRRRLRLDVSKTNIEYLREVIADPYTGSSTESGPAIKTQAGYEHHCLRQRQAELDLQAILEWHEEADRRMEACGRKAAEIIYDAAAVAEFKQTEMLFSLTANTFQDLAYQSAALDRDEPGSRATAISRRLQELAGISLPET